MEPSLVFLQRPDTGERFQAELWDDITDTHLELWKTTWLPVVERTVARLTAAKVPRSQWPQDMHWEWDRKTVYSRKFFGMSRFAITCGGALQGLMWVDHFKMRCRLQEQLGKEVVYIEYVSTAPWNRCDISGIQQFSGVGPLMMAAAIERSRQEGFKGRIACHSLNQACSFYRDRCSMSELGPDPDYHKLVYFEMTPAQANNFLPNTK